MSELVTTHTSTVTEDQIDHLGHMNVRYYGSNARAATRSMLQRLGADTPRSADMFDVYTRHHNEQLLGNELEVRSGVLDADASSIRIYHELANAATGELAATFVYRVRTSVSLEHVDTIEVPPHGAPRSIDLSVGMSTPTLETVRELGLEMRSERIISVDDTAGNDTVTAHAVPMLIWGGTAPDGSVQDLTLTGPNGENMGWATLETRIGISDLPKIGARLQAFGATVAIADKTTQMTMWSFDVETGELVVSFEVVSVLFNIDQRRAMPIPDDLLAGYTSNFHPSLGAGA